MSSPPEPRKRRVGLACVPCRSKHIKCDAIKPSCNRCRLDGETCHYARSRRQGPRRSTLNPQTSTPPQTTTCSVQPASHHDHNQPATTTSTTSTSIPDSLDAFRFMQPDTDLTTPDHHLPILSARAGGHIPPRPHHNSIVNEDLIGLYYTYFHPAHSCALPRWSLRQHTRRDPEPWRALLLVMQYIGSLFEPAISSDLLKNELAHEFPWVSSPALLPVPSSSSACSSSSLSPHELQASLLYSIAAYWCDEVEYSIELVGRIIRVAKAMGMNRADFATEASHASGTGIWRENDVDAVLEESWRRTWWQINVVEAHISGITHNFPTRMSGIEVDVLLPCEEDEYESGKIPSPRTIEEYDMREFLPETDRGFSSYAHLVGLLRTLDVLLSAGNEASVSHLSALGAQLDISLVAWWALLPPHKKSMMTFDGSGGGSGLGCGSSEVDMQLFKANMMINTFIVDIHRRISSLTYNTIEAAIARCAPEPPQRKFLPGGGGGGGQGGSSSSSSSPQAHTAKCLRAVRRIGDLLSLLAPDRLLSLSPFCICMIAVVTVAHLSACRRGAGFFSTVAESQATSSGGQERTLKLERERIRSTMGVLRVLGECWPLGKRTYGELGVIAREILGLGLGLGGEEVDHGAGGRRQKQQGKAATRREEGGGGGGGEDEQGGGGSGGGGSIGGSATSASGGSSGRSTGSASASDVSSSETTPGGMVMPMTPIPEGVDEVMTGNNAAAAAAAGGEMEVCGDIAEFLDYGQVLASMDDFPGLDDLPCL